MGAFAAILARSDREIAARTSDMLEAAPHRGRVVGTATSGSAAVAAVETPGLPGDAAVASSIGWIGTVTGRIDNAPEALRALPEADRAEASTGHASLAIALVRRFGSEAPAHLRGVFAGAVSDGTRMWVFRDHLGFRPVFFRNDDDALYAASEPKQVLAGARMERRPDFDALEQIFYGRTSDQTPAALSGVRRLPKGTCFEADTGPGGSGVYRYWRPESVLETAVLSPAEVEERFIELFRQAVTRSLGERTTISLSGGVDSPAVAAFAAEAVGNSGHSRLGALSAVFPDLPNVDESVYVQLVAERMGLELHTYRPAARSLDDAVRWSALMDGPVPTVSVPELNENYALAHRLGYDTLLTGELAEFVIDQRRHLLGHLAVHARIRPLTRMVRLHRRRGVGWGLIGRQLISPFIPGRIAVAYSHVRGLDDGERIPDWLDAREVDRRPYREDLLVPGRRRWLDQQLLAFPGPGVTIEADEVCQSINDVVVRRPFADVDLWEFFLALPAEQKFPDAASKTLVRRCLRGRVPDEILDRRDKTAFNDHMVASADYEALEHLLVRPRHRLRGVDYERLGERIQRREFTVYDHFWARDLAAIHAFLEEW